VNVSLPKINTPKFDLKNVNPRFVLDAVLALICVVLFFQQNQTTLPVLIELTLLGCIVAADRLLARNQRSMTDNQTFQHSAIVLAASSYVNDGIAKLKTAKQTSGLDAARSGMMLIREALVQSPAGLGDFIAVFLTSLTGCPETIDSNRLANWPESNTLNFNSLEEFEAHWLTLRDSAIYLMRATGGIGVDRKSVAERRTAFTVALGGLTNFRPPQAPEAAPISTTT
jgi:hypothetical protein